MNAPRISARQPQGRTARHPDAVRRSALRFGVLLLLVGVVISGCTRTGPRPAAIPSLNLEGIDPAVAATLRQYLRAAELDPRSGPSCGKLGALLWAYDFRSEACQCLAEAERLDPMNPRWPYYHGIALLVLAPGAAFPRLRHAVDLCGNDPEAPRFRLATLLAEQGQWDSAVRELDELLRIKPEFAPARLLRARAFHVKGQLAEAATLAQQCTNDPRTARSAWALLAVVERQRGNAGAADSAQDRSVRAAPDEGFADPFQAEVTLLRGDPRALSEQAHPLLAAGRLEDAAALIDRLSREHSSFPDTWLLTGRLQYLRKQYAPAEQSLRRFLDLRPQSTQGLFQLGSVLLAQGRFVEAAIVFGQATRLKPDFGAAYFNQGIALARAGKKQEAAAAFKQSLRHNPERVQSYLFLADLELQLGQIQDALGRLTQAESIEPGNAHLRSLRERATRLAPH